MNSFFLQKKIQIKISTLEYFRNYIILVKRTIWSRCNWINVTSFLHATLHQLFLINPEVIEHLYHLIFIVHVIIRHQVIWQSESSIFSHRVPRLPASPLSLWSSKHFVVLALRNGVDGNHGIYVFIEHDSFCSFIRGYLLHFKFEVFTI